MEWFLSLLVGVIITAVAYMACPVIKLIRNQGKFEKKRARKIALWNSIVVGAIFCVLTAASESGATWSAGPAFLYYWINSSILTDKNSH